MWPAVFAGMEHVRYMASHGASHDDGPTPTDHTRNKFKHVNKDHVFSPADWMPVRGSHAVDTSCHKVGESPDGIFFLGRQRDLFFPSFSALLPTPSPQSINTVTLAVILLFLIVLWQ